MTENSLFGSANAVVQAGQVHGDVHVHAPPTARLPVPRQLPPLATVWADRDHELAQLAPHPHDVAAGGSTVWVVTGVGGIGKTSLAVRALSRIDPPGGLLFAALDSTGTPRAPASVLRSWLTALGYSPAGDDVLALWRTVTAQHPRLGLVLDGVLDEAQVWPLLPAGQGHVTIITSRTVLPSLLLSGARSLALPRLPARASQRLLHELLARTDQRAWTAPQLAALAAEADHLPLRLCLRAAAACVPPDPHSHTANGEPMQPIETLLDALDPEEYAVFCALRLLPVEHAETAAVAAAAGVPHERTAPLLAHLQHRRLVEPGPAQPATWRLHDEVRAHLTDSSNAPLPDAEPVLRRWADWLLASATAAEQLLAPWHRQIGRDYDDPPQPVVISQDAEALEWLHRHETSLSAAVTMSEARGWDPLVYQTVSSFWPYFHRLKPLEFSVQMHERGLAAARRCQDRLAVREMLTSRGVALRGLGRYDEAEAGAREALESAAADEDERGRAQALNQLGNIHAETGQPALARLLLEAALAAREALRDRGPHERELYTRQSALTRLLLGRLDHDQGRHTAAIDRARTAATELRGVGDRLDAARALALCAEATGAHDGYEPAAQLLHRAEEEFLALGALPWQARIAELHGRLATRHGRWADARAAYEKAIQRRCATPDSTTPQQAARLTELLDQLPTETETSENHDDAGSPP